MSATAHEKRRSRGIETVLVAVGPGDGDRIDRLADEAIAVAGPADATVVLGHVFAPGEYEATLRNLNFSPDEEVDLDAVTARYSPIRSLVGRLSDADVDVEVRGVVGEDGGDVVDLAEAVSADMLFVGGRTRSPTGKALFGSTAQRVLLSAPCPVTFVRADAE
ncbi:MAG: universal stress protein [Salinigranum sp.]